MNLGLLVDDLERDEGLRLKPYTDTVGKLTIGIGRNLTDKGILRGEAYRMLHNDIEEVIGWLDSRLPWWTQLSEPRQRALANMCFNLGPAKLLTFEHTLERLRMGDYEGAAKAMLDSLWAKQVGPRATRLAEQVRHG